MFVMEQKGWGRVIFAEGYATLYGGRFAGDSEE